MTTPEDQPHGQAERPPTPDRPEDGTPLLPVGADDENANVRTSPPPSSPGSGPGAVHQSVAPTPKTSDHPEAAADAAPASPSSFDPGLDSRAGARKHLKTRLRRLGIWLALGLLLNLALTFVIFHLVHYGRRLGTSDFAGNLPGFVPVLYGNISDYQRYNEILMTVRTVPGFSAVRLNEASGGGLPRPQRTITRLIVTESGPQRVMFEYSRDLKATDIPEHPWINDEARLTFTNYTLPSVIIARRYGWPLPWIGSSFVSGVEWNLANPNLPIVYVDMVEGKRFAAPETMPALGVRRYIRRPFGLIIPTRVHILPLLFNSAVLGGLLWWLFAWPRRLWRRQRGWCLSCGYDITSMYAAMRSAQATRRPEHRQATNADAGIGAPSLPVIRRCPECGAITSVKEVTTDRPRGAEPADRSAGTQDTSRRARLVDRLIVLVLVLCALAAIVLTVLMLLLPPESTSRSMDSAIITASKVLTPIFGLLVAFVLVRVYRRQRNVTLSPLAGSAVAVIGVLAITVLWILVWYATYGWLDLSMSRGLGLW